MNNEICVKTEALAMEPETAEAGPGPAPEDGDTVEFTGTGRVTRSDAGNTFIEVTEINGTPVSGESEESGEDSPESMKSEIEALPGGGY